MRGGVQSGSACLYGSGLRVRGVSVGRGVSRSAPDRHPLKNNDCHAKWETCAQEHHAVVNKSGKAPAKSGKAHADKKREAGADENPKSGKKAKVL